MWSNSFLRHFGSGRPWPSEPDNNRKRRFDKRHASSSSSEKTTQHNSNAQQNVSSTNTPQTSWWARQRAAVGSAFAGIGAAFEKVKPKGLEVKVDVDMIKPTVVAARKTVEDTWAKVPPPAQVASRYLGVAFLSAWIMNRIDRRAIRAQSNANDALNVEVIKLEGANRELRSQAAIHGTDMAQYVTAVGGALEKSTIAAARAAEAAAVASESCAIYSKRGIRPIPRRSKNDAE